MRKADLVDAILDRRQRWRTAPATPNGAAEQPRRRAACARPARRRSRPTTRSPRWPTEEDALGADAADADDAPMPRPGPAAEHVAAPPTPTTDARPPRTRPATAPTADGSTADDAAIAARRPHRRRARAADAARRGSRAEATAADDGAPDERDDDGRSDGVDAEDERQSFGEGNRRRPAPSPRSRRPGAAGRRRAAPTEYQRRADRGRGPARPARRGLRLPARRRATSPAATTCTSRRQQVRRFGAAQGRLRQGRDAARRRATRSTRRCCASTTINGMTPDEARSRPRFEDLTPLFPDAKLQPRARRRPGRT